MSDNNKKKRSMFGYVIRKLFLGGSNEDMDIFAEELVQSPGRTALNNFLSKKLAMTGVIGFIAVLFLCFVGSLIYPLDVTYQDTTQQNLPPTFSFLDFPKSLNGNATSIDGGSSFGIGVDKNNNVVQWGVLTDKLKEIPNKMGNIVKVSAGLDHALALNDKGDVFTWGNNRLGIGKIPMDVKNSNIIDVETGVQFSIALDDKGKMYVWGNENFISVDARPVQGQIKKFVLNTKTVLVLLNDATVACLAKMEVPFSRIPDEIQGNVKDLATTDKAAAVITNDGRVVVWGNSDHDIKEVPERIQGHASQIVGGRGHFTVLLDDGTLESWGLNNYGQANAPNVSNIVELHADYFHNYAIAEDGTIAAWGLKGYLMGSDQYGRDLFRRLLVGGRVTLTVGAVVVVIMGFLGILIGGICGFYGGRIDNILQRFGEIINSIPFLPLALILSFVVGNRIPPSGRMFMIMIILGALSWPGLSRLVRGQILAERENEFVTAARAMGVKESAIIFKHILPNIIAVIIVNLTLALASSMLIESSLSFLGFGVLEPDPTWGNMLTSCNDSKVISTYWWRWVFPSAALGVAVICINLIGDGLRDAIDPKSNDR